MRALLEESFHAAAAAMAVAVEQAWPSDAPLEGIAVTRYQHGLPTKRIGVVEAGHPVPDEAGEKAAREISSACARWAQTTCCLRCFRAAARACYPCLQKASRWRSLSR